MAILVVEFTGKEAAQELEDYISNEALTPPLIISVMGGQSATGYEWYTLVHDEVPIIP